MKAVAKRILLSRLPVTFSYIQARRSRKFIERTCAADGRHVLARQLADRLGGRVHSGPFAGMMLNPKVYPQHMSPKLLGTYEDEIHPFIRSLQCVRFGRVINIGCAEGYYAIGAALMWPMAGVFAFDLDSVARRATLVHARLNRVEDRVVVRTRATKRALSQLIQASEPILLICDCEGYEAVLMDPETAPELRRAHLIVEMHPQNAAGIVETLLRRFKRSHRVQVQWSSSKDLARYSDRPWMDILDQSSMKVAVNEFRDRTPWLLGTPIVS